YSDSIKEVLDMIMGRHIDIASIVLERWVPLIEHMSNDIDVRLNLALKEIEELEDNEYVRILRQAPRHMVRLMLEQKTVES
ncbi:MAG: hypothetical protein QXR94_02780, partial [Candidatus Nitrosocaldus sp.]